MDVATGGWRQLSWADWSWADWQAWWQKLWFTPQLPRLAGYQVIRGLLMPARVALTPLKRKYLRQNPPKQQSLREKSLTQQYLKQDATNQNYLSVTSHQYLGIAPSPIIPHESATEPLLETLLPQDPESLLSENTTDVSTPSGALLEIAFYELWWAKPKVYLTDHHSASQLGKSQLGSLLHVDHNADQLVSNDAMNHHDQSKLEYQLESAYSLVDPSITEPRPPLPPMWLRPLVRFTAWLENTNIKIDQEISALTVQVNTALATIPTNTVLTSEAERIVANRAFAAAFAESLQGSRRADQTSTPKQKQSHHQGQLSPLGNGTIEHLSYDENTLGESNPELGIDPQIDSDINSNLTADATTPNQWQKIQNLLAAALDYFTGKSTRQLQGNEDQSNSLHGEDASSGVLGSVDSNHANNHRQNLTGRQSPKNLHGKVSDPQLQGNESLGLPQNLDASGMIVPNFTEVPISFSNSLSNSLNHNLTEPNSINSLGNQIDPESLATPPQPLATQDPLTRLSELLNAAAAYFFGKKSQQPTTGLNESTSVNNLNSVPNNVPNNILNQVSEQAQLDGNHVPILDSAATKTPWLSLEDVFGSDDAPWSLPTEYDPIALNEMNNLPLPQFANGLAISETTTTQITADRLTTGLAFDQSESSLDPTNSPYITSPHMTSSDSIPVTAYRQRALNPERPLRAWIETQAQSLGYVYGPVMSVVHWLDSLTVKIENFLVMCGQKIKRMFRWLFKR